VDCGAHFAPNHAPSPGALDGVTRCSGCVEREVLRAALAEAQARLASEVRSYQARLAEAQAHAAELQRGKTEALDALAEAQAYGDRLRRDAARALLLEVASAGIEHHTRDYVVIQLPLVTWDALETLAQEGKP